MEDFERVIRSFGLKLDSLEKGRYCWEGDGVIRSNSPSNFLHELAHWQVAEPDRRKFINFGLGDCPDETATSIKSTVMSKHGAQKEEELASILGILWEKKLNLDWRRSFMLHCWDSYTNLDASQAPAMKMFECAREQTEELIRLGLISKNLMPYAPSRIKKTYKT